MGIDAKRFEYEDSMQKEFINHAVVPPGSFWCEWLDGRHLSVDYRRLSSTLDWEICSAWRGEHLSTDNLTKFEKWTKLPVESAPSLGDITLPMDWIDDPYVTEFNLEVRGGYVTEVHLRLGNYSLDDLPIGTSVIPLWDEDEIEGFEYRANKDSDMQEYKGFGRVSNIRKGFKVIRELT